MTIPRFSCALEGTGPAERPASGGPQPPDLLAVRARAARQLYQAECAVHDAHQAVRGARDPAEAAQCDRWLTAAYEHLHAANTEYIATTRAVHEQA